MENDYVVLKDETEDDPTFFVWEKSEYESYVRMALQNGGTPTLKLISFFKDAIRADLFINKPPDCQSKEDGVCGLPKGTCEQCATKDYDEMVSEYNKLWIKYQRETEELKREAEVFKDAMVERNDRCNELQSSSEYWKQRCLAIEDLWEGVREVDYVDEITADQIQKKWDAYNQLKQQKHDAEPICDHDNIIVETAADFYCPKCQRMVSWLEYHSEKKLNRMREIKFRAWDKNQKRMVPDKELQMQSLPDFKAIPINESLMMLGLVYDLMQYTGLKDKNGKQIYAGDLVRQSDTLFEIRACAGGFECQIWKEFKNGGAEEGSCYVFACLNEKYCEVVGNIYENPELLNRIEGDERSVARKAQ